ncbi:hypothetical protein Tco_1029496 [Tanacetum coccineum]|uniref:Uncharacterized protein n=1 Tax=Tanacetum coccineum TaxID=301880 RepID=A0ABQ5G3X0_9ASTR
MHGERNFMFLMAEAVGLIEVDRLKMYWKWSTDGQFHVRSRRRKFDSMGGNRIWILIHTLNGGGEVNVRVLILELSKRLLFGVFRRDDRRESGIEALEKLWRVVRDIVRWSQPLCPIADRYDWEGKDEGKNSYLKM